jgi:hypothetical protein
VIRGSFNILIDINIYFYRSDMAAAVIGDTLYVMGGYDGDYDALNSKSDSAYK